MNNRQAITKLIRDRWLGYPQHSYATESLQQAAQNVRESAAMLGKWAALEDAGLVEFATVLDDDWSIEDLEGDSFDIAMHADSVSGGERTIVAQQKRYRALIEQDGVWGIVGSYRTSADAEWAHSNSVWGFAGDEWRDSGYDTDVKSETIERLVEALRDRCPFCRKCKRGS